MTDYKSDKRNLLQTFVQACVIEERRQRVAFEFSNPKKYAVAISRFAHDTESLCKTKALVSITDSEHIPTEYMNGTLQVFDYYQKRNHDCTNGSKKDDVKLLWTNHHLIHARSRHD